MFDADGEDGLIRFWDCFQAADPFSPDQVSTWPDALRFDYGDCDEAPCS